MKKENRDSGLFWGYAGALQDDFSRTFEDALLTSIDFLDLSRSSKILDLGCGTGRVARAIVKANPKARVHGVDLSQKLIEVARGFAKLYDLPGQFSVGEAEALDFKKGAFDQVISTFGVIFASDPKAAASELARICRPQGKLVISAWKPTKVILDLEAAYRGQTTRAQTGPLSPHYQWADRRFVKDLLGRDFRLNFHSKKTFLFAPNAEWLWSLWSQTNLSVRLAMASSRDQEKIRRATLQFLKKYKLGSGICLPRDYLVISAIRRGST